ncbi:hypothetical protein EHP00_1773 [Ecytonucleospora hepatopenaei]|uniref:Uncharacterized protein n=1 Tax=Ecytonucleospora hepatopenaei TaxID=646526 RepID=A0A1W0E3K3_9MICR|nr:hypothetical protein EHP00_1773 [Ecytonucleospora hepatopenaei]
MKEREYINYDISNEDFEDIKEFEDEFIKNQENKKLVEKAFLNGIKEHLLSFISEECPYFNYGRTIAQIENNHNHNHKTDINKIKYNHNNNKLEYNDNIICNNKLEYNANKLEYNDNDNKLEVDYTNLDITEIQKNAKYKQKNNSLNW